MHPNQNPTDIFKKIEKKTLLRLKPEAELITEALEKQLKKSPEKKKKSAKGKESIEKKSPITLETVMESCREATKKALSLKAIQTSIADQIAKRGQKSVGDDEDFDIDEEGIEELYERELINLAGGESGSEEDEIISGISQEIAFEILQQVFQHFMAREMDHKESAMAYQRILMSESEDLMY